MDQNVNKRAEHFKNVLENMAIETIRCPCCGNTFPVEDKYLICNPELEKYLKDSLEVVYNISGHGKYISSRMLIEYGGPTTYIDTGTGNVEVHWGGKTGIAALSEGILERIDSIMERMHQIVTIEGEY